MIAKHKIFTLFFALMLLASCNNKVYLFTSFHEPANEGLRMLYSKDGYNWKSIDSIYLKPIVGKDKIMREKIFYKQNKFYTHNLIENYCLKKMIKVMIKDPLIKVCRNVSI